MMRNSGMTIAAAIPPKKHFAINSERRFFRMNGVSVNMVAKLKA